MDRMGKRKKHKQMIRFYLNDEEVLYTGQPEARLLSWLRLERRITSPKDGCSGQGSCGACTVEINARPRLACRTLMKEL